jgi:predicted TIM-barrel fold metal-dependent hydrolase
MADFKVKVFDADGHVMEKDEELIDYFDPPFKGRHELLIEPLFPSLDRINRVARSLLDVHLKETTERGKEVPKHGIEAAEEATAEQWLKFLDAGGIEGVVLYPTLGLSFGAVWDADWAVYLARAYNNWLYHRFLKVNTRLRGMALIPIQNPSEAVKELRRAVGELGMVGAVLPGAGLRRALGERFYFPIYETAQELDVPLAIHAGSAQGMGLDIFERAIEARTLSHSFGQIIQMTSLMFNGVFDLFPRLRFVFLEGGVAWVPFALERMQRAYRFWAIQAPELKREPKDHLTSGRLFFHAEVHDPFLPMVIDLIGDESLIYASDFPHEPTEEVLEELREFQQRPDLSDETKQRILYENAHRLYKL